MKNRLPFLIIIFVLAGCLSEQLAHRLTVVNGSGSGIYTMGTTVVIQADTAPPGQAFFRWTGDTAFLSNSRSPKQNFAMPLADMTLTATYADLPRYQLVVSGGNGSGEYIAGTVVQIEAILPSDSLFVRWKGDTIHLGDPAAEMTELTMPDTSVFIEAIFEPAIEPVSFSTQVFPIIQAECAIVGCHVAGTNTDPYTSYQEIKPHAGDILFSVSTNYMPPSGPLPPDQRELIIEWVNQGAKNN